MMGLARFVGGAVAIGGSVAALTPAVPGTASRAGTMQLVGVVLLVVAVAVLAASNRRLRRRHRELALLVDEQRTQEETLIESAETLRAITESAQDGIVLVDEKGRISYWNPAAEAIFGWRRDEVLGRDPHDFLVPERLRDQALDAGTVFRATGEGQVIGRVVELSAVHRDGVEIPIEISVARVDLREGIHAVAILRDVTDRVRAREALEQVTVEAQAAAQAKSQFLANMSHEIRTPLNAVIGMTELLLDSDLNTLQREFAEIVGTSGEALLGVINDILDFSKVDAGHLELEKIDFNLRTLVEDVGDVIAVRAAAKDLEVILLIHPGVPERVVGDPGRLRQILTNLLGNAVKFTEVGEVVVGVSVAAQHDDRAVIDFRIEDTGIGIESDRMPAIFESFAQADASTTRKYGGTGLGLAISRRLVTLMGGDITVDSEVGRGSTFRFTIDVEISQSVEPAEGASTRALAGTRVLVVDDNGTNRQLLRELLMAWRCDYSEAASGSEALALIAAEPAFDIIILDFAMPAMDGEEVARRIRDGSRSSDAPLVLLTSAPRSGDGRRMEEAGFDAYLTKPIKRKLLFDAIAEVLDRAEHQPASVRPAGLVTRHSLEERRRRGSRVLLVEDNQVNQRVAVRLLERLGVRCDVASNGADAVDAVARQPYDLVLMDCQMPVLDGYEATRRIRTSEGESPRTPVVALTAGALDGDRERCLAAGMDEYITKPIRIEELQRVLESFLGTPAPHPVDAPTSTVDGVPVDLGRLRSIAGSDVTFQRHLVGLFVDECNGQIGEVGTSLASCRATEARRAAHSLKGAAANIGAEELRRLAAEIEVAAKDEAFGTCRGLLPALEREAEAVAAYLTREVLEKGGGSVAGADSST